MRLPSDLIVIMFVITIPFLAIMITVHTKYTPIRRIQDMMALGWSSVSRAADLPFDGQCVINFTGLVFGTSSYIALFQPVNCEFWDISSRNISFFKLVETHIQTEGHCQCHGQKYLGNRTNTEGRKNSQPKKKTTRTALEEPNTKRLQTTDSFDKMKSLQTKRETNTSEEIGTKVLKTTEGVNKKNLSEKPTETQITQELDTKRLRTTDATQKTKSPQTLDSEDLDVQKLQTSEVIDDMKSSPISIETTTLKEIGTELLQTIENEDQTNPSEKAVAIQTTKEIGTDELQTTDGFQKTKSSQIPWENITSEEIGTEVLQTIEDLNKTNLSEKPIATQVTQELGTERLRTKKTKSSQTPDSEDLGVEELKTTEEIEKTKSPPSPVITETLEDLSVQGVQSSEAVEKTNVSQNPIETKTSEDLDVEKLQTSGVIDDMKSSPILIETTTLKEIGTELLQTIENEDQTNPSEKAVAIQTTKEIGTDGLQTTDGFEETKSSQIPRENITSKEIGTEVLQTIEDLNKTNLSEKPIATQVTQELGTERLRTEKTKSSQNPDSEDLDVEELKTTKEIEKIKSPPSPVITETLQDLSVQGLQTSEAVEKTKLSQNPIETKISEDLGIEGLQTSGEIEKTKSQSPILITEAVEDLSVQGLQTSETDEKIATQTSEDFSETYDEDRLFTKESRENNIRHTTNMYFETNGVADFNIQEITSTSPLFETLSTSFSYNKQASYSNHTNIENSSSEFGSSLSFGITLDTKQDLSESSFSITNKEFTGASSKHEITPPMPLIRPYIPSTYITRESKKGHSQGGNGSLNFGQYTGHSNYSDEIKKSYSEYERFLTLLFNKNRNNSESVLRSSNDSFKIEPLRMPEEISAYGSIATNDKTVSSLVSFEFRNISTQIEKPISNGESVLSIGRTSQSSEFKSLFSRYLKENIDIFSIETTTEMSEYWTKSAVTPCKVNNSSYFKFSNVETSDLPDITSDIKQEFKSSSQYINSLSTRYFSYNEDNLTNTIPETEQFSLEYGSLKSTAITMFNQDTTESESQYKSEFYSDFPSSSIQNTVLGKTVYDIWESSMDSYSNTRQERDSNLQNFGSSSTEDPDYGSDISENLSTDSKNFGSENESSLSSKVLSRFSNTYQNKITLQLTNPYSKYSSYSKEESGYFPTEIGKYSPEYENSSTFGVSLAGEEQYTFESSEYGTRENTYSNGSSKNIPKSDIPGSSELSSSSFSSYLKNNDKIFSAETTLDVSDYDRSRLTDTSSTSNEMGSSFQYSSFFPTGYTAYYKNELESICTEVTPSFLPSSTVERSEYSSSQSIGFEYIDLLSTAYSSYSTKKSENSITFTQQPISEFKSLKPTGVELFSNEETNSEALHYHEFASEFLNYSKETSSSGSASGISEFEEFLSTDTFGLSQSETVDSSQYFGFSTTGYINESQNISPEIKSDSPFTAALYSTNSTGSSKLLLSKEIPKRALKNEITMADASTTSKHKITSNSPLIKTLFTMSSLYSKQDFHSNRAAIENYSSEFVQVESESSLSTSNEGFTGISEYMISESLVSEQELESSSSLLSLGNSNSKDQSKNVYTEINYEKSISTEVSMLNNREQTTFDSQYSTELNSLFSSSSEQTIQIISTGTASEIMKYNERSLLTDTTKKQETSSSLHYSSYFEYDSIYTREKLDNVSTTAEKPNYISEKTTLELSEHEVSSSSETSSQYSSSLETSYSDYSSEESRTILP